MSNGDIKDWKYDEATRLGLEQFIEAEDLTQTEVAARVNLSATRIAKYLNLDKPGRVPEPDMPKVEAAIKSLLRHARRRGAFKSSLFENSVTIAVGDALKLARRLGDISLIHGPAGIGKTCGCELFARDHASAALFLTIREYAQGARSMEDMLFREYLATSASKWPGNVRYMVWLEQQLRGADRIIVIDNAHQMHLTAFRSLFNFHDETGIPIGLVGNPEVLKMIRNNDQLFSRIGVVRAIKIKNDQELTARRLIVQLAPESGDELVDAASDVVSNLGHARSLKKQLTLAAIIYNKAKDWPNAFAQAGTQLIKSGGVQ